MTAKGAAVRLGFYYIALFLAVGTHLPFWPLWLVDKGLNPTEIGWIVAATFLVKIAVNPVIGHLVDGRGDRRRPMVALAVGAAISWLAFAFVDGFWGILGVTLVAVGFWAGIMPVGESLAMMTATTRRLDYGRVRLWGSLSFIAAATLVGQLLVTHPPAILMILVAAALALTALACLGLPDIRPPERKGRPAPLKPLLVSVPFLLFLLAASFNQAGHTVYYSFASIHWKAAGIPDDVIGLLWSEGVIAEVVLFAFSGLVVARAGPAGLLLAAGLGGIARWLVLGLTTDVTALAVIQLLHAATFGCAHLGAMHFIQRAVPPELSGRAQALYAAAALGVAPGLLSPAAGWLYTTLDGGAFVAMSAFAAATSAMAWALARRWDGGKVC